MVLQTPQRRYCSIPSFVTRWDHHIVYRQGVSGATVRVHVLGQESSGVGHLCPGVPHCFVHPYRGTIRVMPR